MALFRRNIWLLFGIIAGTGFIFSIAAGFITRQSIKHDLIFEQKYRIHSVEISLDAVFEQQEQIFDIMVSSILQLESIYDTEKLSELFKPFLENNPLISAVGFLDPAGNYIYISNGADPASLPNLIEQEESRDTFLKTLESDSMVLGRTYYFLPLDSTIIPMRKSIRNSRGEIIAVLEAAIDIRNPATYFSKPVYLNSNEIISVIREFDNYVQYRSTADNSSLEYLDTPIPDDVLSGVFYRIEQQSGHTREDLKISGDFATAESINRWGDQTIITFTYNSGFDFWIVSDLRKKELRARFIPVALYISGTYLSLMCLLFMLTRTIYNAERRQREILIHQAEYDYLTNLPNLYYLERIQSRWTAEDAPPFYLIAFDIDNYKYINDYFGQNFGNKLLKEFSGDLIKLIGPRAVLARIEGDEFYIFSRADHGQINADTIGNISTVLSDILSKSIQNLLLLSQGEKLSFSLGISAGIVKFPDHGRTIKQLYRSVDIALLDAKKHRNASRCFTKKLEQSFMRNIDIQSQLGNAIENDELYLMYQPQIDARGRFYGVEALARWNNADLGLIPPGEFIGIAEQSGYIIRMGDYLLERTLMEMCSIQKEFHHEFSVSVNISVKQFLREGFLEKLESFIKKSRINRFTLTLEITENIFIEDLNYLLPLLSKIQNSHCKISLDDFGTGYSSLSMLKKLPLDEIKIDRAFVENIVDDPKDYQLIKNIISIANNQGCSLVAEGVETSEQIAMLKDLGCSHFQGYYYSKPLSPEDLRRFIGSYSRK